MTRPKRTLAALAISSAVLWLGTGTASAIGKPDKEPAALPAPYTAPLCGAAIGDVTFTVDADTFRAKTIVFTLADGSVKIEFTGYQAATVTGNGKTLHLNISGPGYIKLAPDGTPTAVVAQGHLLYIGPPGTTQPGLRLYTGNTVLAVEPSGNAIVTSYSGHVTDICMLLG
jgi:hypothetical protein